MFTNAPTMRHFVPCTTVDGVGDVPELWEGENVLFQLSGAQVASSAAAPTHKGALFVTSKRVLFLGEDGKTSYDFDVPFITLHAVSRDPATFPRPCVYCQLDCEDLDFTPAEGEDDDENEEEEEGEKGQGEEAEEMHGTEEDEEEWKELFIVPEEEKDVMAVFEALSQAALLNPDEEDEGGDDDFIYNLDEVRLGAEEARVLNHLESVFQFEGIDEEGFEGIEEEETEEDREEERANNMEE